VASALVIYYFGLREELLDYTDAQFWARRVSSPTEEEHGDLDRIGLWESSSWNLEVSKLMLTPGSSPPTFLLVEADPGGSVVVQRAAEGGILGDIIF
jgi:hypothetical protein